MTSVAASVIKELKRTQIEEQPQQKKLKHKEVRKILKKERRRSKRKGEAEKGEAGNRDNESPANDSEEEEYLRSKNLWLMREARIFKQQQREIKRKQAIERAERVIENRGLIRESSASKTELSAFSKLIMTSETQKQIYYFSFGSNLLTSRMRVYNKDAVKVCIGRLDDWRLVFSGISKLWDGCPANIIPAPGDHVLGVVWRIFSIEPLDAQEVHYRPIEIAVKRVDTNEMIKCRSYVQLDETVAQVPHGLPSLAYKNVILAGARESAFPDSYIRLMQALPDNGRVPEGAVRLVPESGSGWPIGMSITQ